MLEKEGGGGGSGKMRAIGVNSSSGDNSPRAAPT